MRTVQATISTDTQPACTVVAANVVEVGEQWDDDGRLELVSERLA